MQNPLLVDLPESLHASMTANWSRLQEVSLDDTLQQASAERQKQFQTLVLASQWAFDQCMRQSDWLRELLDGSQDQPPSFEQLKATLEKTLSCCDTEAEFYQALRQFRNFHQLCIIWRDVNRLCDMPETGFAISGLADCLVNAALDWLYLRFCEKHGMPCHEDGSPMHLLVIGMGKLGGQELNLSSDIDLIFCYAKDGETRECKGSERTLTHQQFFLRLGQALIKSLSQMTADGFVYRVDMRLRPLGASGPLVTSFQALENYFQLQGREWERYAMVKARVLSGTEHEASQLQEIISSFVYRRFLDFAAIDSMRDMKGLIQSEVRRKGLDNNVKLGAGGIREAEFIAQTFQLIQGGRNPQLHERNLLKCYQLLEQLECLPTEAISELRQAYCFLRNSEHLLQAFKDEQTQSLPLDELRQLRLAQVMGFESFSDYMHCLNSHRTKVNTHFSNLVSSEPESSHHGVAAESWRDFWLNKLAGNPDSAEDFFISQRFSEESFLELAELKGSKRYQELQDIGRQRLDSCLPALLSLAAEREQPDLLFKRFMPLIEAIMRRSNYLSLLIENRNAMLLLLELFEASDWLAKQFAANPILLDELLDEERFYSMANVDGLEAELRQQLLRIESDDLEAQMEALRYFKLSHGLRVAAMEMKGRLPLMKVSDYLTWIAEAILSHVLNLAWVQMTEKHGFPSGEEGVFDQPRFVILAYGKMGGIELSHGSDLDLVFIHDAPVNGSTTGGTDGKRSLDNTVFFTRLGQRIIHILNTRTSLGPLYEVDMRLRPSGASGLLVSSLHAFEKYQLEKAWSWEHQALVRARVVAGNAPLAKQVSLIRKQVMLKQRDAKQLATEVKEMREKMREHLLKPTTADMFPLKHGFGGIVDIEFMVQYAVLAWSHFHPDLAEFTDNIRILQSLAGTGILSEQDCLQLMASYQYYRTLGHQKSLRGEEAEVEQRLVQQEAEHVRTCWQKLLGE